MHKYKLKIEYDGSNFVGWQKQNNGISIQESIEKALAMNQPSLQEGVDYIFVLEAVNKQETQTELVDVVVYDDGYTY